MHLVEVIIKKNSNHKVKESETDDEGRKLAKFIKKTRMNTKFIMRLLKAHVKIKNDDLRERIFNHTIFCESVCVIFCKAKCQNLHYQRTLITLRHIHFRLMFRVLAVYFPWTMPRNCIYSQNELHLLFPFHFDCFYFIHFFSPSDSTLSFSFSPRLSLNSFHEYQYNRSMFNV